MKRKLLFAVALATGALGTLRAQDLVSPTPITVGEFTALSGSYTIEVSATSGTEVKVPFDKYSYFTYTPTVTGTVRFVIDGGKVWAYEKASDASLFSFNGQVSTFTEVTYPDVTDATVSTNNLLSDGDFSQTGEEFESGKRKLAEPWQIGDDSWYKNNNIRVGSQASAHDGSVFFWRADPNPTSGFFYQEVTSSLHSSGNYKVVVKVVANANGTGPISVCLGSTASGYDYDYESFTTGVGTYTKYLTTPATLAANSYFSVCNRGIVNSTGNTSNHLNQIDYIVMVEANAISAGITGTSSAQYVAEAVYPAFENGTDMTDKITNATVASTSGWTNGRINTNQQYEGAPDNTYMDTWNDTRDQKQSFVLPAGYYILKAATRADASISNGNIYVYANGANLNSKQIHKEGSAGNMLGNGWAWTRVPFTLSEPANVTIGFYSECGGNKWAGADNFSLTYYDSAENLAAAAVQGAKDDAAAWKTKLTGTIPTAGLNALQAAIDNASATVSSVESAISTARSLVTPYANYIAAKANMDAIAAVATTDASKAASRKAEFLDAVVAEADAAATPEAINTAINNIKPAVLNYIKKLTPSDAENAPFDLTFMITNPSFSTNEMTGWNGTKPNFGNDATQKAAYACEYYQSEFDIYQELTDMATGNYRLKVKAYQRPGASGDVVPAYVNAENKADGTFGTTSEIYVNGGNEASQAIKNAASPMITTKVGTGNESEVEVDGTKYYIPNDMVSAVAYFSAGYYENEAEILATSSTIKFGFRSTATHVAADWTIFDDFRLYYIGQLDLSTFAASLASKVSEANSVKTSLTGTIPAAALTALQTAIDDNDNSDEAFEEEEQYTAAIANLEAAIVAAQALVIPFQTYNTLRADIQALHDVSSYTELEDGAHTTLGTALSTAASDVAAATTTEGINTITSALKSAGVAYAAAANPTGNAQFNLTFMLTNPDVTELWDGTWWIAPEGWYKDQTDGNFQVMQNNDVDAADGVHKVFMEYYYLADNKTYDNGKFNIYTKATLPVGTYTMTCYAFAKEQNYSSGAANPQVYFYANDTQGSLVNSSTLTEQSISFVNATEQEVKIGLKPLTGNTYNWMGIGYVGLYKVPTQVYAISENTTYDNSQSGAGEVTLTRSIKAEKYNTVVLPFAANPAAIEAIGGTGAKAYTVSAFANDNVTFAEVATVPANEPFLLYATVANDGAEAINLGDQTIVAGTPSKTVGSLTFTGSYAASVYAPEGSYVVSDNSLYVVDSDVTIKGTRAYFTVAAPAGAKARVLSMTFDGDATGIATIGADGVNVETGVIYNLNGQRVAAPQKGIYIVNGKKVLFK